MMRKKIRCLVVDDAALARDLLQNHINKIPTLTLVAACSDATQALLYLEQNTVDIIFSDIEMPNINGLHFVKQLKNNPIVIMTTAYSEYAIEGFDLGVIDYLLKPITFERFSLAVERAMKLLANQQPNYLDQQGTIFIKTGNKQIKIAFDDIIYIEANGDYINIHTNQKRFSSYERMKNILKQLPQNQFFRIHHSYIINSQKISAIHQDKIELGEVILPISEKKRGAIKAILMKK